MRWPVWMLVILMCAFAGWCLVQPKLECLDREANLMFHNKALVLSIVGKDKQFVQQHFGKPAYRRTEASREVWCYHPGPFWALWRSECKVGFELGSETVVGWAVNCD